MNTTKLAAIAFFVLAIIGCSYMESYLDLAKDKGLTKAYNDVLNKWTRQKIVYSQFETKVQISATYKGNAFNKAYLEEYARIYNLTEAERKRRSDMQAGFASDFREFFFYAYIPDKEANDFEKPNSIWRVFLLDEKGNRVEPLEIRKIEKITPVIEEFYPYINKYYGMCYSLKFPPAPDGIAGDATSRMRLIFTGVPGKVELTWP
jgi:hypothetical protein